MFRYFVASFLLLFSIASTAAFAAEKSAQQILREKRATEVRVSVRYNFAYPLTDTNSGNVLATQEKGRRAFYAMVTKECRVLLETMATECRVGNINVNNRVPNRRKLPLEVRTSGSATFHIQLKAAGE